MKESKEIIEKIVGSSFLDLREMSLLGDLWDEILEEMDYLPVLYTRESIKYQQSYFEQSNDLISDLSKIIFWDNKAVGVMPLTLSKKENSLTITSQGHPIIQPLLIEGLPSKTEKKILRGCANLIIEIGELLSIESLKFQEIYTSKAHIGEWQQELLNKDSTNSTQYQLVLDITKPYEEIRREYRKSYKSLINGGARFWNIQILDGNFKEVWKEFKDLHEEVSGRKTRSSETWEIQRAHLESGSSVFIYLRNESGIMVGGGLFNLSKHEAIYAVGAYKRELFDKPLGHLVQDEAIKLFIEKGISKYKIGNRPYKNIEPIPSEKELSIADFKQGFGAQLFLETVLVL